MEAQEVRTAIATRLEECRLELHPEKTTIVYCKDNDRRRKYPNENFDFLGYTFRPRRSKIPRPSDEFYSAAEVTVIPTTSPGINISTRRFRSRPAAVALGAAGFVLPKPAAVRLVGGTP
jgi:hypothetical protein